MIKYNKKWLQTQRMHYRTALPIHRVTESFNLLQIISFHAYCTSIIISSALFFPKKCLKFVQKLYCSTYHYSLLIWVPLLYLVFFFTAILNQTTFVQFFLTFRINLMIRLFCKLYFPCAHNINI